MKSATTQNVLESSGHKASNNNKGIGAKGSDNSKGHTGLGIFLACPLFATPYHPSISATPSLRTPRSHSFRDRVKNTCTTLRNKTKQIHRKGKLKDKNKGKSYHNYSGDAGGDNSKGHKGLIGNGGAK